MAKGDWSAVQCIVMNEPLIVIPRTEEKSAIHRVDRVGSIDEAMEDDALPASTEVISSASDALSNSPPGQPGMSNQELRDFMWNRVEATLVKEAPKNCDLRIIISRKDGITTVAFDKGQDGLNRQNIPVIERALNRAYLQFERMRRLLSIEDAWKGN